MDNIHQMLNALAGKKLEIQDRMVSKIASMGKGITYVNDGKMPSFYLQQDRDFEYAVGMDVVNILDIARIMQSFAVQVAKDKPKDKHIAAIRDMIFDFGDALMQKKTTLAGYIGWYTEEELKGINEKEGRDAFKIVYTEKKDADISK